MFTQMLAQVYRAKVLSDAVRQVVYPVGAPTLAASDNAAAAWAWSAYVQIVAAATIADPCWLVGVTMHTGVVGTFEADFAIASGAALAEVDLAIIHVIAGIPTAVGVSIMGPTMLPYPIRIAGAPRLAVRVRKDTGAGLEGVSMKVLCVTGVGT